MKQVQNNKKHNSGFSLSELLMVILVLSLATSVAAVCFRSGVVTFAKEKDDSNGQQLFNALAVAIEDELRYATAVDASTSPFKYSSRSRAGAKNCQFAVEDGKIVVTGPDGDLPLVNDSMYKDVYQAEMTATYAGGLFNAELTIKKKDGTTVLTREFAVEPLNVLE